MKILLVCIFLFTGSITLVNAQKMFYIDNNFCFQDTIYVSLSAKESKGKNKNEAIIIKTLEALVARDTNELFQIEEIICFFSKNYENLNKKNKQIFATTFKRFKEKIYKRDKNSVYFIITYKLNRTKIKEVDDLNIARISTLKYLEYFNKSQKTNSSPMGLYAGEKEKIEQYKQSTEIGIKMLIDIYKTDINRFYALSDFQKALRILNLHAYSKREIQEWINIIGKETDIWVTNY